VELILSWTPRQFRNFIKGAQHKQIDEYERMARGAMFNRYAMNAKKATEKKMFDADKARKRLEKGSDKWKDSKEPSIQMNQYKRMKKALQGYTPVFTPH
jgi:hypothetical protein